MKAGDLVRYKAGTFFQKRDKKFLARVISVIEGYDVEDHGAITVEILESDRDEIGQEEHFVHFGWSKTLEIVRSS